MKRYALCILGFVMALSLMLAIPVQAQNAAIKVLLPEGGKPCVMTKTCPIQWKTTGTVDKVQIALMKDDKVITTIAKDLKNKGDYLWTVPDNLPLSIEGKPVVRIRVMSMDGKVVGDSEKFEIARVQ